MNTCPPIGIMQGRLVPPRHGRIQSFPVEDWSREFPAAQEARLDFIEWIFDVEEENPLRSAAGIAQMQAASTASGVVVRSVCADYFMSRPLLRGADQDSSIATLHWLVDCCAAIGVQRVILPFVDASSLQGPEEMSVLRKLLTGPLQDRLRKGVEVHLETDLPPDQFARLLESLPGNVWANYDSGNSASLGFEVDDEFASYGTRIGSVHVKDRVRGGGTIPLGQGSARLPALFNQLRQRGYARDLVLQTARGPDGEEVSLARQNRNFVQSCWEAAAR